ncbi:hypothetical protein MKW94_001176, partial [Papaver nudicaule]|nr:hypothetical protein [Papaver nudicaule]
MGVYTFQCHRCDGIWRGKQYHGDLEASAESTYDLQRKLVKQVKLTHDAYSGDVQSSFSLISPSAAVFQ